MVASLGGFVVCYCLLARFSKSEKNFVPINKEFATCFNEFKKTWHGNCIYVYVAVSPAANLN